MFKADLARNVAFCNEKIANCDSRIASAEFTGEDVKELKERKAGYLDKRDKLAASEPDD